MTFRTRFERERSVRLFLSSTVPRALASTNQGTGIVQHFLTKTGSKADVEVVGKAVNRGGGYGMEVPCVLPYLRRGSTVVNI